MQKQGAQVDSTRKVHSGQWFYRYDLCIWFIFLVLSVYRFVYYILSCTLMKHPIYFLYIHLSTSAWVGGLVVVYYYVSIPICLWVYLYYYLYVYTSIYLLCVISYMLYLICYMLCLVGYLLYIISMVLLSIITLLVWSMLVYLITFTSMVYIGICSYMLVSIITLY